MVGFFQNIFRLDTIWGCLQGGGGGANRHAGMVDSYFWGITKIVSGLTFLHVLYQTCTISNYNEY